MPKCLNHPRALSALQVLQVYKYLKWLSSTQVTKCLKRISSARVPKVPSSAQVLNISSVLKNIKTDKMNEIFSRLTCYSLKLIFVVWNQKNAKHSLWERIRNKDETIASCLKTLFTIYLTSSCLCARAMPFKFTLQLLFSEIHCFFFQIWMDN